MDNDIIFTFMFRAAAVLLLAVAIYWSWVTLWVIYGRTRDPLDYDPEMDPTGVPKIDQEPDVAEKVARHILPHAAHERSDDYYDGVFDSDEAPSN
jgi:hypothetical protein